MQDLGLKGRVVLVTGASRNIGRSIALAFADAGASVAIVTRSDREAAETVSREIEAKGVAAAVLLGDVGKEEDAARLIDQAVEKLGRLDILVNNAAIRREAPIASLSFADWKDVFGVTLDGAFLMSRAAIPHLKAGGQGAIINIGGLTAYTGAINRVHVVAAKAGLDGFTKALAHELGAEGVTVNLVSPGMIDTNRQHATTSDAAHHKTTRTLVGRRGTPEEVAAAVLYLAGAQARYTTGQTLHVNGGAFLP